MVFNSTWSKDYILVKRCVALLGDILKILCKCRETCFISNKLIIFS